MSESTPDMCEASLDSQKTSQAEGGALTAEAAKASSPETAPLDPRAQKEQTKAEARAKKEAARLAKRQAKEAAQAAKDMKDVNAAAAEERRREHVRAFRASRTHIHIIVDSCGDFDPDVAEALGVEVVGFPYVVDGQEHIDDLFQEVSAHEFYDAMRHGAHPTTSAVTPGRYYEIFKAAAEKGKPTVYLAFTEALSSSVNAAREAAKMVREEYPGFELYVVDNLCPSGAAQLLAIETVHQANQGASVEDLVAWVEEARHYIHGYFTLENFDALARGGRIPASAASLGGKLDIKPELSYDPAGALVFKRMCRGRKKALRAIVEDFRAMSDGERSMPIGIITADAEKDGDWLEALLRREPGCEDIPIVRSSVSPVIGSHVGPGMVALVFWGKDRRESSSLSSRIASKVTSRHNS